MKIYESLNIKNNDYNYVSKNFTFHLGKYGSAIRNIFAIINQCKNDLVYY